MIGADISSSNREQHMNPKRIARLLDRIEKHAWTMANEGVYAFSYEPGTRRWEQANARARKAESACEAAIAELRALIAKATGQ